MQETAVRGAEGARAYQLARAPGNLPAGARSIASGDFTMKLAGSATGTLYGKGSYFAESVPPACLVTVNYKGVWHSTSCT